LMIADKWEGAGHSARARWVRGIRSASESMGGRAQS
jgi:hypothetical protein